MAESINDKQKDTIKDAVQRAVPHQKITLKTADAVGILLWAIERGRS